MNKKNVWILVISVVVVLALAAGLLYIMLGNGSNQTNPTQGEGNTTQGTDGEIVITDDPTTATDTPVTTQPDETTNPSDTTVATEPTTTQPTTTPTTPPTTPVGVDMEDDDDSASDGVISFDDLLASMG